jgi:hypothetical protein
MLLYLRKVYMLFTRGHNRMLTKSSASIALQTPNIMRCTRHMEECLEALSVSDKVLCAHVRLQHILEEFETQLASASSRTAVEVTHRVAKRQLAEWASVLDVWDGTCYCSALIEPVADLKQIH